MKIVKMFKTALQQALSMFVVIGRLLCSIDLHWWKKTGKYGGMLVNGKYPDRYTCKRCGKTKNVAWV